MATAPSDLRLPSQLQDIAAVRLVPNYTAWWQRHMCELCTQGRYLAVERPVVELATSEALLLDLILMSLFSIVIYLVIKVKF